MKIYDAAVIGAGPAGITAALYLVRSGRSVILFEKLTPGGQVLLTDSLENYPGFPKGVKGWELADAFAAHLEQMEGTVVPAIGFLGAGVMTLLLGRAIWQWRKRPTSAEAKA